MKKLRVQLGLCFKATGIANKYCLEIMTESSRWAVSKSFATDNQYLEQLTVHTLLLLAKLATYSVQLRKESLHLSTGVLFNNLATCYNSYMKKKLKKRHHVIPIPIKDKLNPAQDHKISFCEVPTFEGGTPQGG